MRTNTGVTILNQYNEIWCAYYIEQATWITRKESAIQEKGLVMSDSYNVRIPVCDGYMSAAEYTGVGWTLSLGTYLVKGDIPAPQRIADLQKQGLEMFKVLSYSDNRDERISKYLQHWRVSGA